MFEEIFELISTMNKVTHMLKQDRVTHNYF